MPSSQALCTNCGSVIPVDAARDAAICEHCSSPFIVEKAINNYNAANNIEAGTNQFGGNSADFVIRAGVLMRYNGASTEVIIPDTVTIIGDGAFDGCEGLTKITFNERISKIGENAFRGCVSLGSIKIPSRVWSISSGAFEGCEGLEAIRIPKVCKMIKPRVFKGCVNLKGFVIPHGVKEIGDDAFAGCIKLKSIKIPGSVTSIGNRAFDGCRNLASVDLPSGITFIGMSAFRRCRSITGVTIPKSVNVLSEGAFELCKNLTVVDIPEKLLFRSFEQCIHETDLFEKNVSDEFRKGKLLPKKVFHKAYDLAFSQFDKTPYKKAIKKRVQQQFIGFCYIATAVYGSYHSPEVMVLRRFRDETLEKSLAGRMFIRVYYTLSPPLAQHLTKARRLNSFVKNILDKVVLYLSRNDSSSD